MSVIGSNVLAGASGSAVAGYEIERSLRFNSADSAYLNKTPSSVGNRKTWTWSGWVKRCSTGSYQAFFSAYQDADDFHHFRFRNDEKFETRLQVGGSDKLQLITDQVFRDFSAWYHVVFVYDSTQSTASNRAKLYINGSQITDFSTETYPSQNDDSYVSNTTAHYIGQRGDSNLYHNGYLADVHFIDGQALAPTDFGEYDDNNVWQPKEFAGTYTLPASGTVYSSQTITDENPAYPTAKMFDGQYGSSTSLNNSVIANQTNGTYSVYTFAAPISYSSSVRIYGDLDTRSTDPDIKANNTSVTGVSDNTALGGANKKWYTVLSGSGTLSTISLNQHGGYVAAIYAIEVDGTVLVDGTSAQGANSFHLPFTDNSSNAALGTDSSGNSNTWTVNNLSVASGANNDSLIDTPTNYEADTGNNGGNYCTWNSLVGRYNDAGDSGTAPTFSNGNLNVSGGQTNDRIAGTLHFNVGQSEKYYWEVTFTGTPASSNGAGVRDYSAGTATQVLKFWYYNGSTSDGGPATSFTTGDVLGFALDLSAETIDCYKNGGSSVGQMDISSLTSVTPFVSTNSGVEVVGNFGQRPFAYTPPTGFKSLCTQNLPDPTIADGSTAMDVDAYTGNGSTQERSEFSFEPDLVWIKARSAAYNHYLVDQVRGFNGSNVRVLQPNLTNAEESADGPGDAFASFDDDGFTVKLGTGNWSGTNQNNATYVAWAWDAGANSSKTYTVKVVSDGGNKFRFDDFGTSAVTLDLEEGSTYVFDQSDSSNATHPLRFATAADAAGGTEYTTGVTTTGTPGQTGAKTTITVASGAPTLYYYCSSHTGMGGQANTNSTAGASSFAGSIQSTVRANASAGFSIVSYVGTQAINTIGHGLNATPQMFIVKSRDTAFSGDWRTYHLGIGDASKYLKLHSTAAATTGTSTWNSTEPNSSVFTLGTGSTINKSGDNYIAYCFAPVEGYSAFGSYTGNGSSDGPFVFTNFRPALVICKPTTTTGSWQINDSARNTFNVADEQLFANESIAATTTTNRYIDFLSNGFKVRGDNASFNGSGHTYVYLAFSENPFKTARAR